MKFTPLGQRVLVKREEEAAKTASGIIIPDNAKEKPLMGIVKSVSKELTDEGKLKNDDRVVFAKYSGTEITLDGEQYLVLNIDDILGVLA
ncbi:MAG: co-chaperone GroES [Campylobacterales bacterium]|nr:co-chaperone GroES [Campylobacterales bacterium]